ncbi:hypothetical protein GQ42DRAFT_46857 [Ramicandelaber brevisporus]|nr:hypothetical protein GQ42DRAFT_46857 [Ramicandelaber brevisporus]
MVPQGLRRLVAVWHCVAVRCVALRGGAWLSRLARGPSLIPTCGGLGGPLWWFGWAGGPFWWCWCTL